MVENPNMITLEPRSEHQRQKVCLCVVFGWRRGKLSEWEEEVVEEGMIGCSLECHKHGLPTLRGMPFARTQRSTSMPRLNELDYTPLGPIVGAWRVGGKPRMSLEGGSWKKTRGKAVMRQIEDRR